MPTAIWNSPLRSGSAHWDLELAVEVRQCPLGSGSRGWDLDCEEEEADCDLEVAVGIWTARRRTRRRWRRRMRRRRRRTALIRSNNPHLAGGEQIIKLYSPSSIYVMLSSYQLSSPNQQTPTFHKNVLQYYFGSVPPNICDPSY